MATTRASFGKFPRGFAHLGYSPNCEMAMSPGREAAEPLNGTLFHYVFPDGRQFDAKCAYGGRIPSCVDADLRLSQVSLATTEATAISETTVTRTVTRTTTNSVYTGRAIAVLE